jgi:hypothetical protein
MVRGAPMIMPLSSDLRQHFVQLPSSINYAPTNNPDMNNSGMIQLKKVAFGDWK